MKVLKRVVSQCAHLFIKRTFLAKLGSIWAYNWLWCIPSHIGTVIILLWFLKYFMLLRLIYNIKILVFIDLREKLLVVILFLLLLLLAFVWVNYIQTIIVFEREGCHLVVILRLRVLHRITRGVRVIRGWRWGAFAIIFVFGIIGAAILIFVCIAWWAWSILQIRLLVQILLYFAVDWMVLTLNQLVEVGLNDFTLNFVFLMAK